MSSILLFVFVPIVIVGIAVAVLLAIRDKRMIDKRREDIIAWAEANSLKFLPEKDHSIWLRYQLFKCLQRGNNRYAYNIVMGTIDGRVTCGFDYHYEISTTSAKGGVQTVHKCFSALVVDAGFLLKPLLIRPQRFLDGVSEFIGFADIDFESIEFSQKFFVKSHDRRWAYDVLQQKTMELLLAYPDFHIEFQGSEVMAYLDDRPFSAGEFDSALKVVVGILDGLPESVVQDLKEMHSQARS